MTKKLYIWKTRDEYELPLFVTDSLEELARVCGKTKMQILSLISHKQNGLSKTCEFERIIIEEEEVNWIRKAMDDRGITIEEMADALALAPSTVKNYYRGWQEPGRIIRQNIIRILDLDEEEINEI